LSLSSLLIISSIYYLIFKACTYFFFKSVNFFTSYFLYFYYICYAWILLRIFLFCSFNWPKVFLKTYFISYIKILLLFSQKIHVALLFISFPNIFPIFIYFIFFIFYVNISFYRTSASANKFCCWSFLSIYDCNL
jgi:hypothetical protein